MSQKPSIRHHYLPIFYQKGFCNENGMLHVYDKEKNRFLNESPPKKHFLVKHLNNYRFNKKIISSTEDTLYSAIDNKGAKLFNKLTQNDSDLTTPLDRIEIIHFMRHLFWRTPNSDSLFKNVIKKEGACNNHFGLYNEKTGIRLSDDEFPEFKEKMLTDNEFLRLSKKLIPVNTNKREILDLAERWKLFTLTKDSKNEFIIGDSPILNQNDDFKISKIFNNVVFPISRNMVLIMNENSPCFIDNNIVDGINLSIFHNSKRFIASGNKQNLDYIINRYNQIEDSLGGIDHMEKTFDLINSISRFESFEDYKVDFNKNWR